VDRRDELGSIPGTEASAEANPSFDAGDGPLKRIGVPVHGQMHRAGRTQVTAAGHRINKDAPGIETG
jgi:hypothetical protein